VAFQNSFRSQLDAPRQAVLFDGFLGVMGATGIEAAMAADQQAQGKLVDGNQLDGDSVQHLFALARRGSSGFLDQVPPELLDLLSKVLIAQGADSAAG
jgi:hypothetical protein